MKNVIKNEILNAIEDGLKNSKVSQVKPVEVTVIKYVEV